jgi:hypothetical protein
LDLLKDVDIPSEEIQRRLDLLKNIEDEDDITSAGEITYTNSDPLVQDIGGIKANAHPDGFENVPITDLITELLYPYTAPVINSFSLSPAAGVKEMCDSFTVNSASATITKKSKPISKVELYRGSTLLATSTASISSGTTVSFSNLNDILDVSNLSSTTDGSKNITYYVKVYEEGENSSATTKFATYTFVYPYYHGVISKDETITDTLITGLTKDVSSKGTKNYTYTTTSEQRAVIAYPSSYDNISITDANGFGQDRTQSTVTIKDTNKNEVSYYVYVSGPAEATNFKYTFTH